MNLIKRLTNYIENGDLIPALILVSVPHYASVLANYDFWPVAAVIGFLVDVGHYRTIKLYMRDKGAGWMVVLTLFSVSFHIAFYALAGAGWWSIVLGATPPAVIFALAFISRAEKLDVKARQSETKRENENLKPSHENLTDTENETKLDYETYVNLNQSRNGQGPILPQELIESHGIKRATAYRWYAAYQKSKQIETAKE